MKTLNNYIRTIGFVSDGPKVRTGSANDDRLPECWDGGQLPDHGHVPAGYTDEEFQFGIWFVKDLGITEDFMKHNNYQTELPSWPRGYLSHSMEVIGPWVGGAERRDIEEDAAGEGYTGRGFRAYIEGVESEVNPRPSERVTVKHAGLILNERHQERLQSQRLAHSSSISGAASR